MIRARRGRLRSLDLVQTLGGTALAPAYLARRRSQCQTARWAGSNWKLHVAHELRTFLPALEHRLTASERTSFRVRHRWFQEDEYSASAERWTVEDRAVWAGDLSEGQPSGLARHSWAIRAFAELAQKARIRVISG